MAVVASPSSVAVLATLSSGATTRRRGWHRPRPRRPGGVHVEQRGVPCLALYGGKVGGLTTADQHRQLETDGATASLADEKGGLPPEPAQPIPRAAGPCSGQAGSPGKAATWRACVDADHASRAASYCSCRRPDFGLRALSSCGAQASMAGFHCI